VLAHAARIRKADWTIDTTSLRFLAATNNLSAPVRTFLMLLKIFREKPRMDHSPRFRRARKRKQRKPERNVNKLGA
jgi:hypothetical protein